MIEFKNQNKIIPYLLLKEKYDEAFKAGQKNIEAISISSYDKNKNEVNSRFVNLKFIDDKNFIFFSNYNSPKSIEFDTHNQISALFFWSSTNIQIRMKAKIERTTIDYNNKYFKNRSPDKNALAISSNQSEKISSYDKILDSYNKVKEDKDLYLCPDYWGGFSFMPFYFEFWEGHDSRLNKRETYELIENEWQYYFLQP